MVFEHGIGGSQDLPISLPLALAGGAAALAVSFVVLALAWRRPRYDAATQGRPLPGPVARFADSRALAFALRTVGLLFTAYVVWAAVAGQDNGANPTFGVVYVLLWVGLVPASVLLGPFYRAVNPVRTVHRLLSRLSGGDPAEGVLHLPGRVGLWPASLGLLAFVWMELVSPDATFLWTVRLWFAAYFAIVLVGASLFGDRWIAAADPFEAFSTLVGRLSPFGRRADGVLVVRSPLCNLDGTPEQAGRVEDHGRDVDPEAEALPAERVLEAVPGRAADEHGDGGRQAGLLRGAVEVAERASDDQDAVRAAAEG